MDDIDRIHYVEVSESSSISVPSDRALIMKDEIPSTRRCKCPSVLIVDDEPFNIVTIEGLLCSKGVELCARAYNGVEAL